MGGDFTGQYTIYDPTTQTIAHDSKGNPYPVRKSFLEEYGTNAIPASMIGRFNFRLLRVRHLRFPGWQARLP